MLFWTLSKKISILSLLVATIGKIRNQKGKGYITPNSGIKSWQPNFVIVVCLGIIRCNTAENRWKSIAIIKMAENIHKVAKMDICWKLQAVF